MTLDLELFGTETLDYTTIASPEYQKMLEWCREHNILKTERYPDETAGMVGDDIERAIEYQGWIRKLCSSKCPAISRDRVVMDVWMAHTDRRIDVFTPTWIINDLTGRVEALPKFNRDREKRYVAVDLEEEYRLSFLPFCDRLGLAKINLQDFIDRLHACIGDKTNPWKSYLEYSYSVMTAEEFQNKHGFDPNRACEHVTGDSRDIAQRLWHMHFIGFIKRGLKPGCQHDHMLLLLSERKGLRKSTFLRHLVPDQKYYGQLHKLTSDKSTYEKTQGKLVINIDEADGAFRGTAGEMLKEYVTSTSDLYRAAYAKDAKDYLRTFTLFGTSNSIRIIQDLSGDRRFLPIHVQQVIDVEAWETFRDDYYAFLVGRLNAGDRNWLTQDEQDELLGMQKQNKICDPWMETLEVIVERFPENCAFRISDLLAVIRSELPDSKRWTSEAVHDFLKSDLGFSFGRPRIDGKQPGRPIFYRGTPDNILSRDRMSTLAIQAV